MKFSKPTVLALIILLFIIPLMLFLFGGNQSSPPTDGATPLVTQTAKTIMSVTKTPSSRSSKPSQQIDQPVQKNDQAAKEKLLTDILHGTTVSGVVYTSPTLQIEYVAAADLFQGEVKTTAIDEGKKEAVQWMTKKGFSKKGLCDLPLIFYLNTSISQTLPDEGANFNSLPDGC